ncbi:2-polyprenyl-6-methoxyphenol hydroxylase-like FAD-dependent oxidoreductase [Virgibacillus halotolerans]|uniref:FAD-dependent monooxygenase n=1 Tax=Virgibacillus halotolerans TaxID=1071053 RepID=UPI0019620FD9|nr:FAD-dependent monooxygenase [Virgibacillus halotolerans]MBM7599485.1 2-polyprenyl-6-methoxyphenol hydroxylase-like FAD-dependent oxidoreductase [Virgibacillus halotolerans]
MSEKTIHVPILIVGGGLVGLSTALFLSQQHVPYQLIERHQKTSIHPKASGFNLRTMELYRGLGLNEKIREAGAQLAKSFGWYTANTLMEADLDRTKIDMPKDPKAMAKTASLSENLSPVDFTRCTQDQAEPILLEAARERGGELNFHTELIDFEQNDQNVIATVRNRTTGIEEKIVAEYMVAADGVKGPVRQMLDIPVTTKQLYGHIINIYFEADLSEFVSGREFMGCNITHPDAAGALLAINNRDRWCYHVSYDPEAGEMPDEFSHERCHNIIQKAIGFPDLEVHIISVLPWEAAGRVADRFQKGRVFLAGDAAHEMPPTGGYGANTGVQDAHNLAWKLAAVVNKQAGAGLPETYDAERRPVAHMTVAQAGQIADTGKVSPIKNKGVKAASVHEHLHATVGYYYASQAVIESDTNHPPLDHFELNGRPGTRAPHVWGEHQGKHLSTLDLFGLGFVLLTGPEAKGWYDAAREISEQFGVKVNVYRIGPDGDFIDKENNWQKAYQATSESVILIRPDGFVCWRTDRRVIQPELILQKVFSQILDLA